MDSTTLITEETGEAAADRGLCPRCEEPFAPERAVETVLFADAALCRCRRCGTRHTALESPPRLLFSCTSCGLPFLADKLLPHSEHVCTDCALGRIPADLPDGSVTAATEREVRLALEGRWRFVTSRSSSVYLHRVARQMAARIEGAPTDCRVVLFEDPAMKTLALPSGLILISLGTLGALEDEAQLAFILGHELAHAASGDAAVRLVRLGFRALVRSKDSRGADAWAGAALDLIRLGYGRRRERDADARSMNAMLALGYDPAAAIRYLKRLQARIEGGRPGTDELSLAHPTPAYRVRKLEKMLFGRVDGGAGRQVNREVFKRALERPKGESEMVRLETLLEPSDREGWSLRWLPWAGLILALVVILLLILGS